MQMPARLEDQEEAARAPGPRECGIRRLPRTPLSQPPGRQTGLWASPRAPHLPSPAPGGAPGGRGPQPARSVGRLTGVYHARRPVGVRG